MRLSYVARTVEKKCESNRLRRQGCIPAVIYSSGKFLDNISIQELEFKTAIRGIKKGFLSVTTFNLSGEGKDYRAIVKGIQYDPVTYDVIHLDFEELSDNVAVNVKVPVQYLGEAECVGVKLGGVLRRLIRYVEVRCLPKDIPECFYINVDDLGMMQSKRLSEIDIPDGVKPRVDLNEVVVIVAKK